MDDYELMDLAEFQLENKMQWHDTRHSYTFCDGEEKSFSKKFYGKNLISYEKAQSQALEYEHSLKKEISFLFCHGLLHCYGFDHITKEEEEIMFWHQRHIMDDAGGLESYEKCRKYFEKS